MKKFLLLLTFCATCLSQANAGVVLTENFNLFTAGTDTAPDANPMEGYIDSYTQTPGWNAMSVQQAGGSAYFPVSSALYSPIIDLSANGGSYVVTFKAKSNSVPGMILVCDPYFAYYDFRELTSEWQEYSITLNGGNQASQVVFTAMYSDFYLDDVVISDGGVGVPVAIASTNFTRESFTANWEPVSGADSYLLDVFTLEYNYDTTTFDPVYLLQDKEVSGSSYVVTEGEFDVPYYYVVAAKSGNSISQKSNTITVTPGQNEISAPVANDASNVTSGAFTASWSESNIATKYYLHLSKLHTANSNEVYTATNFDFSEYTDGTLDAPKKSLEYLFEGDWAAKNFMAANGCIGFNNEDISFFGQGSITSPLIQLSNGTQQISVSFEGIARMGLQNAVIQLVTWDEDANPLAITDRDITVSESEWQSYSVTYTDVDAAMVSFIITSTEEGRMFIDNLNVSINLNTNESIALPIRTYDVADLSKGVTDLGLAEEDRVYYYVTGSWAVRQQEGVVRQIPEVISSASNIIWVDEIVSSIENLEIDATNGTAEYYNLQGIRVAADNLVPGFYIVRQGDKTTKVLINN